MPKFKLSHLYELFLLTGPRLAFIIADDDSILLTESLVVLDLYVQTVHVVVEAGWELVLDGQGQL